VAAVLAKKVSALPAIVIITGGNIQPALHQSIIQRVGFSK